MAYYTLCATNAHFTAKPCALIDALNERDAERRLGQMRRGGDLAYIPADCQFTYRRSSRAEVDNLLRFLQERATQLPISSEADSARLGLRRALLFNQLLWRGESTHGP